MRWQFQRAGRIKAQKEKRRTRFSRHIKMKKKIKSYHKATSTKTWCIAIMIKD